MASDINTKKIKAQRSSFDKLMDIYWGGSERRISALTVRIIGINALSLIVLMLGIINLGEYETDILTTKLEAFQKETLLIAKTLEATDLKTTPLPNTLKRITGHEISLFDTHGNLLATTGHIPSKPHPKNTAQFSTKPIKYLSGIAAKILPQHSKLPIYLATQTKPTALPAALQGNINIAAWHTEQNQKHILLTGTAPLIHNGKIIGAVHIVRSGHDIIADINGFWLQMFRIFLLTLLATIIISIYLSGIITRPLRQLTKAAETIRRTKSPATHIPDLSDRLDEIGELSLVMRDMTESMQSRIDTIERFSADVAHELKNPLTSLKSAIETLKISKKKKDKDTLLTLLQHDTERMDRLITDIAEASRLDAELSRQHVERINLTTVTTDIIQRYTHHHDNHITITLNNPTKKSLWVNGLSGRIAQIIDNILTNALSFSKGGDTITVTLKEQNKTVTLIIEDEGPGIPDNKLDTIFERFYSERPNHEDYGHHSGLGLSICRQIITALGGTIKAENRANQSGARFIVTFNKA